MRARWLGTVPYAEAMDLQRAIARRSDDDYLLLLEHPHVYTMGAHADPAHVLADPTSVGVDLVPVDRGGDVTYHGPGQLVGYPVRTVGAGPHRGPDHVRDVEQVVIGSLVSIGIPADRVGRLPGFPGVWVGLGDSAGMPGPRKIASVGVRTSRGRTTHGFALNVSTDLAMFDRIVPCGISDHPVTSLAAEGYNLPMSDVVDAVIGSARAVWGPVDDRQRVTDGRRGSPDRPVPVTLGRTAAAGSPLERRLQRSGVDPAAGLPLAARKPDWLRVTARMGEDYLGLQQRLRGLGLATVCEEAGCPNIYECWSEGTATFMINGSRCTRSCGFCQVDTAHPLPLESGEPEHVAEAVARMRLAHAVVTAVARDDLADGGAGAFAETIAAVRRRSPGTSIEVLVPDCKGDATSLQAILDARPDVFNHNIETVPRLQRAVRPSAGYARSLTVLARARNAGLTTKSGLILGMGEREDEVLGALADLRAVGADVVTLGQYLRPSRSHLPVARWWTPEEFDRLREAGMALGFAHVQASPLTRSSYHAREAAAQALGGRPPADRAAGAAATVPVG